MSPRLTGAEASPPATADATLAQLRSGWAKPARTYRPHTRWWWPGNALTKADITSQLEQMAGQGMGGVEIMSAFQMYEHGNHEYLSAEFIGLVQHAIAEARRLDMEVAVTFGPGWSFGGSWVPPEDQSKALTMQSVDMDGASLFHAVVPSPKPGRQVAPLPPRGALLAVVAGKLNERKQLEPDSLVVLTERVAPGTNELEWPVPAGRWRLMAFWLQPTGQQNQAQSGARPAMVIDHLNQAAVQRYCDHLGGIFARSFGQEFGRTVDSFFCDSFEIHPPANGLLWSTDTLAAFQKQVGYDLTRYLPAIWFDIGSATPRIRYDVGAFMHDLGLRTVFQTFDNWCATHGLQARIQPHYRFTEELVQGAGAIARPETEVTTTRFEPVADPRKATASGARFYGREIVSAEAYTFIHRDRYSTTLQDMKIATDAFLRDGVTQFYNHGYFASPEPHVAPTRDMPWASRISPWNTWWTYYHHLAAYVARSCYLLRQGRLAADVLIYSPQATAWAERALWGTDRRVMNYGDLAKTLVANGYDFDLVNDDLLQHRATFREGQVAINGYGYRVIVLPGASVLPIETARALRAFADAGGTVVALDQLPQTAAGSLNQQDNDRELQRITDQLFASDARSVFLPDYKLNRTRFEPTVQTPPQPTPPLSEPQRKFLAALARVTPPDFSMPGRAQSDGLTFIHKRLAGLDVYFVSNLQPNAVDTTVTFRVTGKTPQRWDPLTGATGQPVRGFRVGAGGTTVPVRFEPWESAFFIFTPGVHEPADSPRTAALPNPLPVAGPWRLKLEGYGFATYEGSSDILRSWTEDQRTRHFSGTGRYELEFNVPPQSLTSSGRAILDLGQVGDIADVELNGRPVGVAWMSPYRLDITGAVRPGANQLVVRVTNQLINYVSGLKAPPEIPEDLQPRLGKANPAIYRQGQKGQVEMSETRLPPSGLLGPVRIVWQPQDS